MSLEVCVLASGSSGNSIYIASDRTKILIDAGLSGKEIDRRLEQIGVSGEDINAIFISHEHIDHIRGAGVFSRRYDTPLLTREATWEACEEELKKIDPKNRLIISDGIKFKDLEIETFSVPHDAVDPCGFVVKKDGYKISVATDMGYVSDEVKQAIRGSNIYVLESNHDVELLKTGPYPPALKKRILGREGHLSNDDAGDCIVQVIDDNYPRILLAHLSKDNNIPELAFVTVKNTLETNGFYLQDHLELHYTYRHRVSSLLKTG